MYSWYLSSYLRGRYTSLVASPLKKTCQSLATQIFRVRKGSVAYFWPVASMLCSLAPVAGFFWEPRPRDPNRPSRRDSPFEESRRGPGGRAFAALPIRGEKWEQDYLWVGVGGSLFRQAASRRAAGRLEDGGEKDSSSCMYAPPGGTIL